MSASRIGLLAVIAALIAAFFAFDLGQYFTLEYLKQVQGQLSNYREANPGTLAAAFFAVYVGVTALSLPGAAILTLAAGAIFGLWQGLFIVSFASSIGATLAFLVSRFLLGETIQKKYGTKLKTFNEGIERDGAFYLFTLRLVPLFPFFVINLLMGLTKLKTATFYGVSQIGMLPGTAVFVNAGTQLAQIDSPSGILSPSVLGAFALLGVFPLIAKKIVGFFKARKVYKGFTKPKKFDRNIIAIGAGAAGLVTSYIGVAVKAKVTLVEKHKMGGDCLNYGCVPSKAIIKTAKIHSLSKHAAHYGLKKIETEIDFAQVMERFKNVIAEVEPHDSVERYTELGVDVVEGTAKILDPWTVQITKHDGTVQKLTTKNIVIAAGGAPFVPDLPGLKEAGYLTSDTIWDIRVKPERLVVLGGGPIGSELSQTFARLDCKVTQIERGDRIMRREDPEFSAMVEKRFREDGVDVRLNTDGKEVIVREGQKYLVVEKDGVTEEIPFDQILVAVGRAARLTGYGLEDIGVETGRVLNVNEFLETNFPNIYGAGDVAGPYQFTHTASHMAWYAAVNALFGTFKKFRVDYSVIPWATFSEPEVARVGLNEIEAKEQGIEYEITTYGIDDLDRAIADGNAEGLVKILTVPGKDKILGVTIAGEHAGDLISEFVLAMKHGLGLNKILGTIHIYPTLAEANKYAAGEWKRAHAPQKTLAWLEKFHTWRRG